MAFSTPATSTAGTVLTAAFLNTNVRDNIAWVASDSPTCGVYRSTAQAIGNTADDPLTFDSERFDNAAFHSTSSNTSRLTVPTGGGGKYLVGAVIDWAANTTGYRKIAVKVNGTTEYARNVGATTSTGACAQTILSVVAMSAADYFEIQVDQSSGGSLNVARQTNYSPEAFAFWFRT